MQTPPPLPGHLSPTLRTGLIARAWLMLVLGLFLAGGMVAVVLYLAPIVNAVPGPGGSPRYHGTHEMTVQMFTLFGVIFLFGLATLANGTWILCYRRQNRLLQALSVILAVGVFAGGLYIARTFGRAAQERSFHGPLSPRP